MSAQQGRVDLLFGQLCEALSPVVLREKVVFALASVREQYVPPNLAPSSADELRAEGVSLPRVRLAQPVRALTPGVNRRPISLPLRRCAPEWRKKALRRHLREMRHHLRCCVSPALAVLVERSWPRPSLLLAFAYRTRLESLGGRAAPRLTIAIAEMRVQSRNECTYQSVVVGEILSLRDI